MAHRGCIQESSPRCWGRYCIRLVKTLNLYFSQECVCAGRRAPSGSWRAAEMTLKLHRTSSVHYSDIKKAAPSDVKTCCHTKRQNVFWSQISSTVGWSAWVGEPVETSETCFNTCACLCIVFSLLAQLHTLFFFWGFLVTKHFQVVTYGCPQVSYLLI